MSYYSTSYVVPASTTWGILQSAYEVEQIVGFNPDTTGIVALNNAGVYPVLSIEPTGAKVNTDLFDITDMWVPHTQSSDYTEYPWELSPEVAGYVYDEFGNETSPLELPTWWGQAGDYAKPQWAYSAQALTNEHRSLAKEYVLRRIYAALELISERVNAVDQSALLAGEGSSSAASHWGDRIRSMVSNYSTDASQIDLAADVEALNNIISPAWGDIFYTTDFDPLNGVTRATQITSLDFDRFYSNSYEKSDLEIYIPASNTTVSYTAGTGFGTISIPTVDFSVVLRVASTGVVVDTLILDPELQACVTKFGYRRFTGGAMEHLYELDFNESVDLTTRARRFFLLARGLFFKSTFAQELTVDTNARLAYEGSLTKVQNVATGTGITIGDDVVIGATGKVDLGGSVSLVASALTDAVDDAAAAAAGVDVNQIYRTGSVLKIRVS